MVCEEVIVFSLALGPSQPKGVEGWLAGLSHLPQIFLTRRSTCSSIMSEVTGEPTTKDPAPICVSMQDTMGECLQAATEGCSDEQSFSSRAEVIRDLQRGSAQ
jgi:hypothetical protein